MMDLEVKMVHSEVGGGDQKLSTDSGPQKLENTRKEILL